jgi:hypothetical protein
MNKATRIIASTFGVLAGIPGIAYGIFETFHGNVATNGIAINAMDPSIKMWRDGQVPALTIIPNYFVTGILAIIFSLIVIIWAVAFIQIKRGWVIWFLFSIVQFIVGGGTAQIMLVPLVCIIASQINSPLTWWQLHLSKRIRSIFAKLWLLFFIVSSLLYFLHYTIPIINGITGSFLGVNDPNLGLIVGYSAIVPFVLAVITGFANDSLRKTDSHLTT